MLALKLQSGQGVWIDELIFLRVLNVGNKIQLNLDVPRQMTIRRDSKTTPFGNPEPQGSSYIRDLEAKVKSLEEDLVTLRLDLESRL